MADKMICTIYRASSEIEDNLLQEWGRNKPKTDEEWKRLNFFQKFTLAKDLISSFSSDMGGSTKRKLQMFVLISPDGSKQSFRFGDIRAAPDNESAALQKAVNAALKMNFRVDQKSLSMFANKKIDRLIFTK